jgi:uncharacterized OB-fold protein
MSADPRPYPARTALNDGYLDGLQAGELRVQRCADCGEYRFPPSRYCPRCLSPDWAWTAVSGRGTLWSWIRMHKRYMPGFEPPYAVCLVVLEEGPRMIAGAVADAVGQLACDLPVKAYFEKDGDQVRVLFGPADEVVR